MIKKINHRKFFLASLRTAIIFISGFLTYEFLKMIESKWNETHPNNEMVHFANRKIYHFIIIFLIDLCILYLIVWLFKINL